MAERQTDEQTKAEQGGESGLDRLYASIAQARLGLAPNRAQQVAMAGLALLLLALAAVPPWAMLVEGQGVFVGFYPLLGADPAAALNSGNAPLVLDAQLWGLLYLFLAGIGVASYLALALTREDWAELIAAEIDSLRRAAPQASQPARASTKPSRPPRRLDWDLGKLVAEELPVGGRATALERMILRRGAAFVADLKQERALELYLRSLALAARRHGEPHAFCAELHHRSANLLRDLGRFGEAEDHYLATIQQREELFGVNDGSVATALASYASMMELAKRPVHVARLHRMIEEIRRHHRRSEGASVHGDSPLRQAGEQQTLLPVLLLDEEEGRSN